MFSTDFPGVSMRPLCFAALLPMCACAPATPSDTDAQADSGDNDDTSTADPCNGLTPVVHNLSLEDLAEMLAEKDFALVNVHVPVDGNIAGTDVDIAYTDVDAIEAYLDHDLAKKAVLYCMTGPMSAIATADLVDLGYCAIYDLPDGMAEWESQGYPME